MSAATASSAQEDRRRSGEMASHVGVPARSISRASVTRPMTRPSRPATGAATRRDHSNSARTLRRSASAAIGSPSASPGSTSWAAVSSDSRRNGRSLTPISAPMNGVAGSNEDLGRRRVLDELAAVHDGDAVAETDRLLHVVGDEEDRRRKLALDRLEVVLGLGPDQRVEGAERLVHQQQLRFGGQCAGDADALLLAAGEFVRDSAARTSQDQARTGSSSSSTRAAMRRRSQPSSFGTVAMFCATVRCGNRPSSGSRSRYADAIRGRGAWRRPRRRSARGRRSARRAD